MAIERILALDLNGRTNDEATAGVYDDCNLVIDTIHPGLLETSTSR